MARIFGLLLLVGLLGTLGACTTIRETQPEQTATEQLLMSTAADKAVAELAIPSSLSGRAVWLDTANFDAYDKAYAIGAIRAHLLQAGARLIDKRADAAVVVEARSGGLSINQRKDLVGLPSLQLPIPLSGPVKTPELALLKRDAEVGVAKFALTGSDSRTGKFLFNDGPVIGLAWRKDWSVVGIAWKSGDVTLPD